MHWLRIGIAAVFLAVLSGCGQPRSQVHGTVRYQGKPLAEGTIVFLAPDNQAYPVKIHSDGSYQIASLPRGRVRVGVQMAQPRTPSRPPPSAKDTDSFTANAMKTDDATKGRHKPPLSVPAVKFPPRYADPDQSGLNFDLQSSEQEYSVDLK
jgi:hypothetical protein